VTKFNTPPRSLISNFLAVIKCELAENQTTGFSRHLLEIPDFLSLAVNANKGRIRMPPLQATSIYPSS